MRALAAITATAAAVAATTLLVGPGDGSPHAIGTPTVAQQGHLVAQGNLGGPPPSAPAVGDVLFTGPGHWSGSPTGFAYAWKDCDSGGANCTTAAGSPTNTTRYQIVSGDTGFTIRVAVTASYSGHPDSTVQSAPTAIVGGGSTAFADTFGSTSVAQGPNQWTVVDNTVDNTNTFDCAKAAEVSESGGNLNEAIASGSFTCPGPTGGNGGISSCPSGTCSASWAAGSIHARDQAFQYGTITYTEKIAGSTSTNNAWPTVWLLGNFCQHPQYLVAGNDPSPCSWHSLGSEEIDVSEWVNGASPTTGMDSNAFSASFGGSGCFNQSTTDASQNFHNYELDWSSGSITTKIDGSTVCTFTGSQVPTSVMFPIISAYMGGTSSCGSCHNFVNNFTVTPAGPNITSAANWPSISGSTVHGNALTTTNGTWTGSPSGFTYQWLDCNGAGASCALITTGSSCSSTLFTCSSSYTTTAGEVGDTIEVLVQATNASGKTVYGSQVTGTIT